MRLQFHQEGRHDIFLYINDIPRINLKGWVDHWIYGANQQSAHILENKGRTNIQSRVNFGELNRRRFINLLGGNYITRVDLEERVDRRI